MSQQFHFGIFSQKKIKALSQTDTCTMFTVELFIIAKIQKQPRYPSKEDWMKKM